MKRRTKGFTLIELMIAVAIVAILAAIAYPSYVSQVQQARRADAQGALVSLSNAMERYFAANNTYVGAALGAGGIFSSTVPIDGGTPTYNLSITAVTANTYTLQAAPVGAQAGNGNVRLTSTGIKTWDANNNGSYDHSW
ncbi:MAG: prepilin-type N-terminal cleavage/methylation domain-containing protein [Gammaproteobacteria bacterium]|nr:prepilin-type N-terminal cleavage/methylation domain-containing protein [Gammaproteobacteria bacterium]